MISPIPEEDDESEESESESSSEKSTKSKTSEASFNLDEVFEETVEKKPEDEIPQLESAELPTVLITNPQGLVDFTWVYTERDVTFHLTEKYNRKGLSYMVEDGNLFLKRKNDTWKNVGTIAILEDNGCIFSGFPESYRYFIEQ